MSRQDRPLLLTPGPLTTSQATREAMLSDWGSRDRAFIELNARVRAEILRIAEAEDSHVCVPLQGSGTFAIEATVGTLVPRDGKLLVLVNGTYGRRMLEICRVAGIDATAREWRETEPIDPGEVSALLESDPSVSHVAAAHCETTTGILNPIEAIADVVARSGRRLLIDAMSAFGAVPLSARDVPFDAVVTSSNKCLEGAPGVGLTVIRKDALERAKGNSRSLSLDLHDQWQTMERNGQWRFTPPTQVLAALDRALAAHREEGGVAGRGARYGENCRALVDGMRSLGFETAIPDEAQAPIIVAFQTPRDPNFDFTAFYARLVARGFIIYPGKLSELDTFRIGCIGQVNPADIREAVAAVRVTLDDMGVKDCAP